MSFCSQCGKQISEKASFCPYCGAKVIHPGGHSADTGRHYSAATGNSRSYTDRPPAKVSNDTSVSILRDFCGSWIFLAFTLLLSLNILFGIFNSLSSVGILILTILFSIPAIIICIGCWDIYAETLSGDLKDTGFSMAHGGVTANKVILIVILTIIGIVVFIIGFALIAQASYVVASHNSDGMTGLIIICADLVAMTLLLALVIYYYNGLQKSINSARDVLNGKGTKFYVSTYSIVILCINAVFSLINLISYSRLMQNLRSNYIIRELLEYFFAQSYSDTWISTFSTILSCLVPAFGAGILIMFRMKNSQIAEE